MKNSKYILFVFIIFMFQTFQSEAQQYNFKNYTPKNGLASSIVNGVFQDSKGYIWFATQGGGISRFNGKTFKNFTKSEGLIANEVNYVTEDLNGNIWIATLDGVSKFDGAIFTNYTIKNGLSENAVYYILSDEKGLVWFATRGGGICYLKDGSFKSYTQKDGLPSDNVFCISRDKKGNYWFGCENGIAKFDGKKIINYSTKGILNNKTFFSSHVDSKGNIWFGTAGDGLFKSEGNSFKQIELPEQIHSDFIGSIAEDKKGNLWFATDHGALKFENNIFKLFSEQQGLSSNGVLSLCCDYEGNIWIGTQGGGVNLFNNESFVNYNDKDGLTSKNISALLQIDDANYIIGTTGQGLNFFNAKSNSFTTSSGIRQIDQSVILSVMVDKIKNIWVGTQNGVFVLQKQNSKYKVIKEYIKVDSTEVVAAAQIIQDKYDNVWISSYGSGVFKIKGDKIEKYNTKNGFVSDNILTVFEDSKSNIWIGTKDGGLVRYDGKSFTNFGVKEGLSDKAIWSITEDKNGMLYFGTGESGLACFDGRKFKMMTVLDGLCSNYIPALKFDTESNCLWIGTEKGINKLTLRENFAIASLRFYGEQEGFKGIEINQNAILVDRAGAVWFGTMNGLSRYNRQYDLPNLTPPKLHLNGIRLAYQVVDWNKYTNSIDPATKLPLNLQLSHKNNNLTFDFQAFTTENVKYSFMLEGQDEQWSPYAMNSEAVFTNINPGKSYTFKVKAINSNGIASDEMISFSFKISPPWWQTWWFYALIIIFSISSIYAFVNYRTAQLAREKKVLEETVEERTAELVAQKEEVIAQKEVVEKQKYLVEEKNREITDSIEYALRIQTAILPPQKIVKQYLENSFILYKPKDIVAGDFYWMETTNDLVLFAACDCTGHGVPGAMVSVVCHNALNRAVREFGLTQPAAILDKTTEIVIENFSKSEEDIKDGMDISICSFNPKTKIIQWAGANNALWIVQNNELIETKANKQPIGMNEDHKPFTNHSFQLNSGDSIYLFTDGFADQFGGENKSKKLTRKKFKELIMAVQNKSMEDQGLILDKFIVDFRKQVEQIDDILVMGVRF